MKTLLLALTASLLISGCITGTQPSNVPLTQDDAPAPTDAEEVQERIVPRNDSEEPAKQGEGEPAQPHLEVHTKPVVEWNESVILNVNRSMIWEMDIYVNGEYYQTNAHDRPDLGLLKPDTTHVIEVGAQGLTRSVEVHVNAFTPEWGERTKNHVGPGTELLFPWYDPDSRSQTTCTANFLFTHDDRYFLGSAAHCLDNNPSGLTRPINRTDDGRCLLDGGPVGAQVKILRSDGTHFLGTMVYNSYQVMHAQAYREFSCSNDFALVEVPQEHWHEMHPAVPTWGGPTSQPTWPVENGDMVYVTGGSVLREPGRDTAPEPGYDSMAGIITGQGSNGFTAQFVVPPVFGDSGSGGMLADGTPVGIVNYINPVGASIGFTSLYVALDLHEQVLGWAPRVVTVNEWNPLL